jgi:hypothetical protein
MRLKSVDIVGLNTLFVGGRMLDSTIKSTDKNVKSLSYDPALGMVVLEYKDGVVRWIPRDVVIMEPETESLAIEELSVAAPRAKAAARKRS